jgi:allophanate hydrolase subunit 2
LRVVPGVPLIPGSVPSTDVMGRLTAQTFKVSPVGNRQGVRLEGQPLPGGEAFSVLSTGVCAGCVQVTSEGLPIILLAEHQTTGGYAVPFVVISADLPRCGQLRPGDEVTFRQVTLAQASHALADVMRDVNAPLAEVPV